MFGKSIQGLFLLLLANLVIKPVWIFGIDRGVQNSIGTEAYGAYYGIFGFLTLFLVVLDLGINNYTTRSISTKSQTAESLLASFTPVKLLLVVCFNLITLLIGYLLGFLASDPVLFLLLALNLSLSGLLLFWRAILGGLLKFTTDSLFSVFDRLVALLIMAAVFYFNIAQGKSLLYAFVLAQSSGLALANMAILFVLGRSVKQIRFFNGRISFHALKESLPYASYVFLMYLYSRMDVVMIELLHPKGAYENGVYAQSFRLVEASNAFTYLFGVVFLPAFGRMLQKKETLTANLKAFENIMIGPLLVFFISISFFGEPILKALYTDYSQASIGVFSWLIFYGLFYSFNYLHGALMTASGLLKSLNLLALFSLALNFATNLWLIPSLGAKGAAMASFYTQAFAAISIIALSYWNYNRQRGWFKNLLRLVAFGAIFSTLVWAITQFTSWFWGWQIGSALLLGLSLLLATGILKKKYVLNTLKQQDFS